MTPVAEESAAARRRFRDGHARRAGPRHLPDFKGAYYEVLGVADEAETGKRLVVYKALGVMAALLPDDRAEHYRAPDGPVRVGTAGALAVCSVARFTELVDGQEYHPGRRVPRFRPVAAAPEVAEKPAGKGRKK